MKTSCSIPQIPRFVKRIAKISANLHLLQNFFRNVVDLIFKSEYNLRDKDTERRFTMEVIQKILDVFEGLPKIVKILALIILAWPVVPAYRVLRYIQNKNTTTLVVGIVCVIPVVGFIVGIIDAISELQNDKVTFYVD